MPDPAYHFVTFQRGRGWQVRSSIDDNVIVDFLVSARVAEALVHQYDQEAPWKKSE